MPEKQIDCIRVGKVKDRKKNWKEQLKKIGKAVADSVTVFAIIIGTGCLAGIGFGWGMTLVAAWL